MTNKVVTLWYRAPELLLGAQKYGPPIDAWAAGCILAELLMYKPLFPGNEEMEQLERIFSVLGAPNERIWRGLSLLPLVERGAVDLLKYQARFSMNNLQVKLPSDAVSDTGLELINSLLTYDPEKRLTVWRWAMLRCGNVGLHLNRLACVFVADRLGKRCGTTTFMRARMRKTMSSCPHSPRGTRNPATPKIGGCSRYRVQGGLLPLAASGRYR
jgi:hypothetical protein